MSDEGRPIRGTAAREEDQGLWLSGLKPGDKVAIKYGGGGIHYHLVKRWKIFSIEKVTKTLFVLENGLSFRRSDGREHADRPDRRFLRRPTPEIEEKSRREDNLQVIREFDWNKASSELLDLVVKSLGTI